MPNDYRRALGLIVQWHRAGLLLKHFSQLPIQKAIIMSTKVARPVSDDVFSTGTTGVGGGVLRAHTRIGIIDIFGRQINRRVSLGTDWNISLETAQNLVQAARVNNPDIEVSADFRINL
jgi:hypothetical protein